MSTRRSATGLIARASVALLSGCAMGIGVGDDVPAAPRDGFDAAVSAGDVATGLDAPTHGLDGEPGFDTGVDPTDVPAGTDRVAPVDRVVGADSCAARAEVCNGLDDNCNGAVDEGFACVLGSADRACSTTCGTTGVAHCSTSCALGACAPPAETCNAADDDCNGRCDDLPGCRTAIARSVSPTTGEHFYSSSASEASCCGFLLESASAYYLYAAMQPGLVAYYRCDNPMTGFHFYTTDAGCEGDGHSEGVMGYIATGATCGAMPLYRLVNPMSGDHLFTLSPAERDGAVGSGYVLEGAPDFAWVAPGG